MESTHKDLLESSSSSTIVFELPGEPAVIINGLPPKPSTDANAIPSIANDANSQKNSGFGEWSVGRDVQKLFGNKYFSGKVTEFDEEMGWYKVVYEDGDSEDLEWQELETVLSPLDVNISLISLATKISKRLKSGQQSAKRKASKQDCQHLLPGVLEPQILSRMLIRKV